MSKKTIYIAGGIVAAAVVSLVIGVVFFAGNANQASIADTAGESTTSAPLVKPANIPEGDTITIGTAKGAVNVKNFYKNAAGAAEQFIVMKKNDNEEINYDTYTSGFSIIIAKSPVSLYRPQAEGDFLGLLGISQVDACKLKVFEGVSSAVDQNLAGRNLGLSFCSGGIY